MRVDPVPSDPIAAAQEAEAQAARLETLADQAQGVGHRRRAIHYGERARLLREAAAVYRFQATLRDD